jgi:hypothetical protein
LTWLSGLLPHPIPKPSTATQKTTRTSRVMALRVSKTWTLTGVDVHAPIGEKLPVSRRQDEQSRLLMRLQRPEGQKYQ